MTPYIRADSNQQVAIQQKPINTPPKFNFYLIASSSVDSSLRILTFLNFFVKAFFLLLMFYTRPFFTLLENKVRLFKFTCFELPFRECGANEHGKKMMKIDLRIRVRWP